VKLAATDAELASKSIRELEGHSQVGGCLDVSLPFQLAGLHCAFSLHTA
jgi:hypothetical protein